MKYKNDGEKMNNKNIVVIGSSNIDLVAKAPQIPIPGQTLTGTDFFMVPGGKGANQAVAAAKLGADVIFVAKLGKDVFAEKSLENFKNTGINTKHVEQIDNVPSGVALIAVDANGQNSIIVVPGANGCICPDDVDKAESDIASAAVVVAQLEIPIETVHHAAELAKKYNVHFILDPAPARAIPKSLLEMVDVIKPNETEAEILTSIRVTDADSAKKAADMLLDAGVKNVIISMGDKGFFIADRENYEMVQNKKVIAKDSTAAGDAFTGALAFGMANGKSVKQAAVYANAVAAVSVTRFGAQPSMPTKKEVDDFIAE
jgi:ribokinase